MLHPCASGVGAFQRSWSWNVTAITTNSWSESDQKAIREQLVRILNSGPFHQAHRRQRFLEYIVNEALAGRGDRLKGYNIAQAVFDRAETFDANIDPVVRMEAGRLRDRLREYYDGDGQADPIHISLPKGTYTPHIEFRHAPTPNPRPVRADLIKQLGMLAAAVLLIVAASLWGLQHWTSGPSLPDKPSVAVLPFDNIGTDPKWDRLADGMTADIITDLSHSKDLVVIARNSTEVYKGKPVDMRQIGRDLNVKYVVEGSIQPMGDQIRVTAQLIEAASGAHIWSERYDRPVDDLFVVQNDVTERIANTLTRFAGGVVVQAERHLLKRKPPANLSAFDTYLLGIEAENKATKESLIEAEGLLRKALQLDPQLARAYVGLVDVQSLLIEYGLAPSVEEALSKMMEAGEKAVQLDPDDGSTHYALGEAYAFNGKGEQALVEFDRAITLAPSDADLLLAIAWVIPALGESERAVSLAEKALTLNPHYPDWYNQALSYVFLFGEQYDKSVKYGLLVKEPFALDYAFLAIAYANLGRTADAEAAAANVKKLDPTWIAELYLSNTGGYAEKEAEFFVNGVRKAGLPACVPADKLKDMPNLSRVKSCDQQRAKIAIEVR
jgi:TolB-like protein/Flp pilus assembly protein TadD